MQNSGRLSSLSCADDLSGGGSLLLIVDTCDIFRIIECKSIYFKSFVFDDGKGIRQIVLALCVVALQFAQAGEQLLGIKDIDTNVQLVDQLLLGSAVAVFNNASRIILPYPVGSPIIAESTVTVLPFFL